MGLYNMTFNFSKIELNKYNALIFTVYLPSVNEKIKHLYECLSIQEKNKSKNFINSYLSQQYIISHGLLRYLLAYYTRDNPQNIEYSFNQFDKPFLKNSNSNIQFNMSHSKDYVVYIIALDCQVGIDIEWKSKNIDVQELSDLVLTKEEKIIFNKLRSEEKLNTFYEVWTKKEAILKANGYGLSYPMKLINVMDISKNNRKTYYQFNNTEFYCSALNNINGYEGTAALMNQIRELIQISL